MAKLVGFNSPSLEVTASRHVTVEDITEPSRCETRDGGSPVVGASFSFLGQHGEKGLIYFFEHKAMIWPSGELDPRVPMPVADLMRYVPSYLVAIEETLDRFPPTQSLDDKRRADHIHAQLTEFLGPISRL